MKAIIPKSPDDLGGSSTTADEGSFEIMAEREKAVLVEFWSIPSGVDWIQPYELMFAQRQHDVETVKVIRPATEEERRRFRVPLWIQDEEVPECGGRPMYYVGQIDDDALCMERPTDAKLWWHDAASFYVFTCSRCLEVKAVGQQF